MILVTIDRPLTLLAKGGIFVLARTLVALTSLASITSLKLGKTPPMKPGGLKVKAKDGAMIWDGVSDREAKKTTVEEAAFEHKLHLRAGAAIDGKSYISWEFLCNRIKLLFS